MLLEIVDEPPGCADEHIDAVDVYKRQRQTLPEADLLRQLDLYKALLAAFPYSPRVTVSALSGAQMIAYGEALQVVSRESHPLGDLVRMSDAAAMRATYFRNNVLHLFALPSLVACAFSSNATMSTVDLQRLARRIYPYIASELFLRWREEEVPAVVDGVLAALAAHGLLECDAQSTQWHRPPPTSAKAVQLSLLAQATIQTIERYYLAVALPVSYTHLDVYKRQTLEHPPALYCQGAERYRGDHLPG